MLACDCRWTVCILDALRTSRLDYWHYIQLREVLRRRAMRDQRQASNSRRWTVCRQTDRNKSTVDKRRVEHSLSLNMATVRHNHWHLVWRRHHWYWHTCTFRWQTGNTRALHNCRLIQTLQKQSSLGDICRFVGKTLQPNEQISNALNNKSTKIVKYYDCVIAIN